MENTVKVVKVDRIASKGLVILRVVGNKPSIVRNAKQFIQDLKNSYLIGEDVEVINHPEVTAVLRILKRFTVTGDITFHKKGEDWTVTENSRVLVDKKHPMFGKVTVGDTLQYTADQARVEGFLDLELNEVAMFNKMKAEAYALSQVQTAGGFADFAPSSSSDNVDGGTPEDAFGAIPEELAAELQEEGDGN